MTDEGTRLDVDRILRERATRLARRGTPDVAGAAMDLVAFRLADERIGPRAISDMLVVDHHSGVLDAGDR